MPEQDVAEGGDRKTWPLGKGFDRYYGFIGGETNQWYPDLVEDNHFIEPAVPHRKQGYHLSKDLADQAIKMIRDQQASNSLEAVVHVVSARAPTMPRTMLRRNTSTSTRASSTTATKPTANGCCRA